MIARLRSALRPVPSLAGIAALALTLAGCTPSIGDACSYATECSARGDRICDTTQPGGYCTIANCARGSCPDDALCVLFGASEPGCPTNDRASPRFGRTYCMAACTTTSDCRAGYVCASPTSVPWSGSVLDDAPLSKVCLAAPTLSSSVDAGTTSTADAGVPAVCAPTAPPVPALDDAAVRRADAAAP